MSPDEQSRLQEIARRLRGLIKLAECNRPHQHQIAGLIDQLDALVKGA